jgi:hypothetical protein
MSLFDKLKEKASNLGIELPDMMQNKDEQSYSSSQMSNNQSQSNDSNISGCGNSSSGLYNPQLEKLIDLALADGELTEKEKQVLFKKAESFGVDLDEFEMVLDAKLYSQKKEVETSSDISSSAPKSNKFGDVKKCPACGAMIQSFTSRCLECGHEFRNIEANQGIERLFDMLNNVDAKSPSGFFGIFDEERKIQNKKSIINNFPIPNTKEDILEFLTQAIPLSRSSCKTYGEKIISNAWRAKCDQLILKAKFTLSNDEATLKEIEKYAKELKIKF